MCTLMYDRVVLFLCCHFGLCLDIEGLVDSILL